VPARIDEKLDKIIKRRFTTSFMSNSKWRKLFTALDLPELMLNQCYWKFVDNEHDFLGWFTKSDELMEKFVGDYGSGPFAFKRIEWVEICKIGKPGGYEKVPFKHWDQNIKEALNVLNKIGQFELSLLNEVYVFMVLSKLRITSHFKGQKTVGFCSCVAYFNQLFFASE